VTIFKEEGLYGYLRGNGTNIIRIFPYSAVQFAAYEQFKKVRRSFFRVALLLSLIARSSSVPLLWLQLLKVKKDSGPLRFLSAGAGAGITSVVATYPLDLIRTRLSSGAAADKQYKGMREISSPWCPSVLLHADAETPSPKCRHLAGLHQYCEDRGSSGHLQRSRRDGPRKCYLLRLPPRAGFHR
jgi:hypothetical protein